LRASFDDPTKAMQTLTAFGFSGTDRFAELNVFAGLAAFDNSTHRFSTLARSTGLDDLVELQIQSLLPAAESANAYVRQMVAFFVATSRVFDHVVENQMLSCQDKVFDELYAGLTNAEECGIFGAKTIKDMLKFARRSTLSTPESFKRFVFDTLHLPAA
jgi:hypothetical protein